MNVRVQAVVALNFLIWIPLPPAYAEWSINSHGTFFYTDDVGIFSATRRLTRDADPTQPAIDSRLTNQGSDGVFEPMLKFVNSFDSGFGKTVLSLRGDGFIFFDATRFSHGTLFLQAQQFFTPETSLLFRYYYSPDLFLGDNEERRSGNFLIAPERVTSHIGSLRLAQELAEDLELRLLARYGGRLYNQTYEQRDTRFWTIGPHLEWRVIPAMRLGVSYHFERGLADGRNQAEFEDDVSYINHYASADLDFELNEVLSLSVAFHYEYNDWLSRLPGDERNGAYETVYQGEILLFYRLAERTRAYAGVQHSRRKESFEPESILNTNVGIGVTTEF